jgi:glycosyl transferase family 25
MTTSFWNAFDRIYVINLASRVDRRQEMDEQLRRVGLKLDAPRVRLFPAVRPVDAGPFPSIGARGCFMSHLGVLREAQSREEKAILVLEDDVNFAHDFERLSTNLAHPLAANDWSIFYGGYRGLQGIKTGSCDAVPASTGVETTHCVGFRGASLMLHLAEYLERQLERQPGDPAGGPMHVDGSYSWFRRERPDLVTLAAFPPIAYQRSSRSDIYAGRLDRLWGAAPMLAAARKLRNRFQ